MTALRWRILDARSDGDYAQWEEIHHSWKGREAFAHPAYVKLFAGPSDKPLAAVGQSARGLVLYPIVLRDVVLDGRLEGLRDITSPYGYGGAFFAGDGADHAENFFRELDAWAASERVVSEFVRFSLFADRLLPHPGEKERKLWNVVRSLDLGEEELWHDFEHKVRKNVNKAKRSGVTIEVETQGSRLDDFLRIYRGTMDRRDARATFYFPPSFFETIVARMSGDFAFLHAMLEGHVVSTELALISDENVYSFLGGTDDTAFDLRPNDLLKYELILWAKSTGKRRFVLGGGYAPDDGIFRYKRAFAPQGILPYYVGKRILDLEWYEALVDAHTRAGRAIDPNWSPDAGFFPAYRAPLPSPPQPEAPQ